MYEGEVIEHLKSRGGVPRTGKFMGANEICKFWDADFEVIGTQSLGRAFGLSFSLITVFSK